MLRSGKAYEISIRERATSHKPVAKTKQKAQPSTHGERKRARPRAGSRPSVRDTPRFKSTCAHAPRTMLDHKATEAVMTSLRAPRAVAGPHQGRPLQSRCNARRKATHGTKA